MASLSMFVLPVTLLAQAVLAVPAPQAPTPTTSSGPNYATIPAGCPTAATYRWTCYQCDTDFPTDDQWLSWDCLAPLNYFAMIKGNDGTIDGPNEADDVMSAILATAQAANMDPRILLAQMMQESVGFVRPGKGDNGASYGLFQVQLPSGGAATCDGTADGQCPNSTILEMVQDGVFGHAGTSTPPQAPGIAYWMKAEGGNVARALRGFNTGSVPDPNDLCDIVATNSTTHQKYFAGTQSYVSDVANRLTGANVGLPHSATCNLVTNPNSYLPASCPAARM